MIRKFFENCKKAISKPLSFGIVFIVGIFILCATIAFGIFASKVANDRTLVLGGMEGEDIHFEYGAVPALGDFDVFGRVKDSFIDSNADFIEANLSEMKLRVYKGGSLEKEVDILTKGREGSWWETPAGIYRIETKEESHFSSFGHVYQPYSMAFQGNFFVHGWPYYPDGKPVESAYSGGCIRLGDEDAKAVYKLAKVGMPIIVFEKDFSSDGFVYRSTPPVISAESFLVADLKNNFVFLEKGSSEKRPVASITKLITALVSGEFINMEREITVPDNYVPIETSEPRIKAGASYRAYDLLFPLLEESSNEVADLFANHLGRDRFVSLMNRKAGAVGMSNSSFVDPSGISKDNISTCNDLFSLAKYIYNNRRFVFKISSGDVKDSVYGVSLFENIKNFNLFASDDDFVGGKVGKTTASKETMVAVCDLQLAGEKRPIAIVVLGSTDVGYDIRTIVGWLKANY